ncbi:uncharacterized protein LOC131942679 isoform X1 [Physella acuta]|uniref:uncharacterized protein LOC131942679 isoform X1 n=1 Tax=Physella acuta TaxID=109671 RepID=UPI0027DCD7AE|nr:uncharacterized protein LOC131942679 isoform X1 [Physella acuta]XP_059158565.1 uncharacterized protein LOC131942679 isoform X1 [Physella acuta]
MFKGVALTMMKLAVVSLVATYLTPGSCQIPCEYTPHFYLNNDTCPPKAVCADLTGWIRESPNGSPCEVTTTINCWCNRHTPCPIDDRHIFYVSNRFTQYTCEPKCSFPWCDDIQPAPIAVSREMNSPEFGGNDFSRIECRCQRHHKISVLNRLYGYATLFRRNWSNATHSSQLFVCNPELQKPNRADPCLPINQSG